MKEAPVIALVSAHYARDEERFRSMLSQIIADGSENLKHRLRSIPTEMTLIPLDRETTQFLQPVPPCDLDLELPAVTRAALDAVVREHEHAAALSARGLEPRRRVLFCGPPGNGKTSAASILAAQLKLSAHRVSTIDLRESYQGTTGRNIKKALAALRHDALLVIEELDTIGSKRVEESSSSGREGNAITNALLTLLDEHRHGFLVATTNMPNMIDRALRRRFDVEIEFPAPDEAALGRCRDKACARFGIEPSSVSIAGCENFDAMTKRVMEAARAQVLAEQVPTQRDLFGGGAA